MLRLSVAWIVLASTGLAHLFPEVGQSSEGTAKPLRALASCLLSMSPTVMFSPSSLHLQQVRNHIGCCPAVSFYPSSMSEAGPGGELEHPTSSAEEEGTPEISDEGEVRTREDLFRELHQITLKGLTPFADASKYEPFYSFDDTPFASAIRDVIKEQGFTEPSPIQAQSWPIALAGHDLVSIGRSGSGKTLGFLLPAFHKAIQDVAKVDTVASPTAVEEEGKSSDVDTIKIPKRLVGPFRGAGGANFKKLRKKTGCSSIKLADEALPENAPRTIVIQGPRANVQAAKQALRQAIHNKAAPKILVVGPTRELVSQIAAEGDKYTRPTGVKAIRLTAGEKGSSKTAQIFLLRTICPDIIMGTPCSS